MKQARWVSGGCLLTMGVSSLLLFLAVALDAKLNPEDPEAASWSDLVAAGIVFGAPPTVLGSVLLWAAVRDRRNIYQHRLWDTFHQLLRQNGGLITPLEFAMQAEITGEVAKRFLDERSREFNADFRVGETGGMAYYFDLGQDDLADYRLADLRVREIEPQDAPRDSDGLE